MTEYMRGTEKQRKIGSSMRHGKKRGGAEGRSSTTVRMKIYKYMSSGDDRVTEWSKSRKCWREKEEGSRVGGGGRGGKGLTEVDCPVCFCYVLRDPVACVCVSVLSPGMCVYVLYNGSTHSTVIVKHMLTCLVCSSAV